MGRVVGELRKGRPKKRLQVRNLDDSISMVLWLSVVLGAKNRVGRSRH